VSADPKAPPSRLVVRAPNWLGDAVMALPAMSALRDAFPGATLTVAAVPAVAPMFLEETGVRPDAVRILSTGDACRWLTVEMLWCP